MSVQVNADADKASRSTALPSSNNITFFCYAKLLSSVNGFACLFSLDDSGGEFQFLETNGNGVTLEFFDSGVSGVVTETLNVGDWYAVGYSSNGTTVKVWIQNLTAGTASTEYSGAANASPVAATSMYVGGDGFGEFPTCDIRSPMVWRRAFSKTDFDAQVGHLSPVSSTSIDSYFTWADNTSSAMLTDLSGNGRDLTRGAGTWEIDSDPPIAPADSGASLIDLESGYELLLQDGTSRITRQLPTNDGDVLLQSGSFLLLQDASTRLSKQAVAVPATTDISGTSAGVATATGTLTTNITAAGTSNGVATDSGSLTTNITLAGALSASSTATATLTTNIKAAGESDGVAAALAALTTAILLAGEADGTSVALGTLTAGSPNIAGESDGVSVATGTLTTNIRFSGNAATASAATGTLTTNIMAAGSSIGVSLAQGLLDTAIKLAGEADGISAFAGTLSTNIRLSGSSIGSSISSADLFISKAMAAASGGVSTAAAGLSTNIKMTGTSPAVATANGSLDTFILLTAAAAASSSAAAALSTDIPLSGATGSVSISAGDLHTNITLSGSAIGLSLSEADLFTAEDDILLAEGTSDAFGSLSTSILLAGVSSAQSDASGSLQATITFAAESDGVAATNGSLSTVTQFAGNAVGVSLSQGMLTNNILLGGNVTATSGSGALLLDINVDFGNGGLGDYGPIWKSRFSATPILGGSGICFVGTDVDPRGVYITRITNAGTETFKIGQLPEVRIRAAVAVYGDWIYFMGGLDAGGTATNTIYRARFHTGGRMDVPFRDGLVPFSDAGSPITFQNGYCYVLGSSRIVARASVDGNGQLDNWAIRAL